MENWEEQRRRNGIERIRRTTGQAIAFTGPPARPQSFRGETAGRQRRGEMRRRRGGWREGRESWVEDEDQARERRSKKLTEDQRRKWNRNRNRNRRRLPAAPPPPPSTVPSTVPSTARPPARPPPARGETAGRRAAPGLPGLPGEAGGGGRREGAWWLVWRRGG